MHVTARSVSRSFDRARISSSVMQSDEVCHEACLIMHAMQHKTRDSPDSASWLVAVGMQQNSGSADFVPRYLKLASFYDWQVKYSRSALVVLNGGPEYSRAPDSSQGAPDVLDGRQ